MKILVVRLDGFTEVLLTTPLIRCLRRQVSEAEIHVLTSHQQSHLLCHNPYFSKLHIWEEGKVIEQLQGENFDYLFDWQNSRQSRRLAKQIKAKTIIVAPLAERGFLHFGPKRHWVDVYFESIFPLGIRNDGQGLDFFIPGDAKVPVSDIPHSHHAGFLCMAVNSTSVSIKQLQKLCGQISHPIILIGGREDVLKAEAIALVDAIKIYNACGKFSFDESADLLRQAKLLVTCNAGWMQVGAALKKEMIILQKARTPSIENSPYYGENFLQQNPAPFDCVRTNKPWWRLESNLLVVNEIAEAISRRLRKR